MVLPPRTNTIRDLVVNLLGTGYTQAAGKVVESVAQNTTTGIVAQRLNELDEEAARLEALGEKMQPDNPVLRAVQADLETVLRANAALIDGAAPNLQNAGVNAARILSRELSLPGLDNQALATSGVQWNIPDPEAVAALVNFSSSPAWRRELGLYSDRVIDGIQNIAVRGFVQGYGPRRSAGEIRDLTEGMPVYTAETLMRTLNLQSYRRGTTAHYLANANLLEYRIRIAVLDGNTCLSCVALHGAIQRLDEEVLDHQNGRCGSIAKVRGIPRTVRRGEDWFFNLPVEQQRAMAGGANFAALQSGAVDLQDFVHKYDDDVFGPMVREASLKEILGPAAKNYYTAR